MRAGEIVVVGLARGPSVVLLLEEKDGRASVAIGRNRQARLPVHRILLATGVVPAGEQQLDEFANAASAEAAAIDLAETWDAFADDETACLSLEDLAELCWSGPVGPERLAALVIHLDGSDYFQRNQDGYAVRPRSHVEEFQTRRKREAERAEEEQALAEAMASGRLPDPITSTQSALIELLRGFAIHGEEYPRARAAKTFLARTGRQSGDLQRLCFELLVTSTVFTPDEPLELHRAEVPDRFPDAVHSQAAAMTPASASGRRDLTHLNAFTIDDTGTKDRDDALSVEPVPGSDNEYLVGVHIADAGGLIPSGSPVDREAGRRMASLYLPEKTIPMLPPELTHQNGSLDPGRTRAGVTLIVRLDDAGNVLDREVTPSLLRSREAMTYEEADHALDDEASPHHEALAVLQKVADARRHLRGNAGAIELEQPEMSVRVEPTGEVTIRVLDRTSPSRRLVAELMVLCNTLLGELCRSEQLPSVYRVQTPPDLSDLPQAEPAESSSEAHETLRRYLLAKRLRPAELDIVPGRHSSLGVPVYIQATSPLRRYPDLVLQRQVSYFLESGKPLYPVDDIISVAQRAEVQIREVARVEAQRKRYWFLKFLQSERLPSDADDDCGIFSAVVLETDPRRRALVELTEYPFRSRVELPRSYSPGATVTLALRGIDLWRRLAHFVHTGGPTH